jgi:hypothetical protein
MRTFIKQEKGSHNCGQIALAHFLGISLEAAVRLVGHNHSTTPSDMSFALLGLGIQCAPAMTRITRPYETIPESGLFKLRGKGSRWHWVARVSGYWYDGNLDRPRLEVPSEWNSLNGGSRLTSFFQPLPGWVMFFRLPVGIQFSKLSDSNIYEKFQLHAARLVGSLDCKCFPRYDSFCQVFIK